MNGTTIAAIVSGLCGVAWIVVIILYLLSDED